LNNFAALKNHPFFEGIDFDSITKIDPPNLNNLKEKMSSAKSMKMINENSNKNKPIKSTNDNYNQNSDNLANDPVIKIIKEGVIKKKSPWFHYNTRKVILDTTPKIEYIDPFTNVLKVKYD
jgi:hypothetical protein